MTTYFRCFGICLVVLLSWGLGRMAMAADIGEHQSGALSDIGVSVTKGAAAGYVPDAVCGECHADKAESFSNVGMAKSLFRPSPERVVEDF